MEPKPKPLLTIDRLKRVGTAAFLVISGALAACVPQSLPDYSAPTTPPAPSSPNKIPDNPIQTGKPLDGSKTAESPLQIWYVYVHETQSLAPTPKPTREPPVLRAPGPQDAKVRYAVPESYLTPVDINGLGSYKVGGKISSGSYDYIPLVSLQSMAITADQLMAMEGGTNLINMYAIAQGGRLVLQGVLLPVAVAQASVSGLIQDEIQGPMAIPTKDGMFFVNRSDLLNKGMAQKVRVTAASNPRASTLEGSLPTGWSLEIVGNPFPPEDWKPPDKNHCGQDMTEYFALLLLQEISSGVIGNKISLADSLRMSDAQFDAFLAKTPLLKGYREIGKRSNAISQRLKDKKCYFYPEGGSPFMDYKLMRDRAGLRAGRYPNAYLTAQGYAKIWNKEQAVHLAWRKGVKAINNMFNENLTTEQAYQLARSIIEQYWW